MDIAGLCDLVLPLALFAAAGAVRFLAPILLGAGQSAWRKCLLLAAPAWGVWLVAGTELLSIQGWITFWPVLIWWLIFLFGCALLWLRQRNRVSLPAGDVVPAQTCTRETSDRTTWLGWGYLIWAALIVVYATISAYFSAPSNADTLAYHLPRIIFWWQQHSVRDYPCGFLMQLSMPPMLEFIGLNLVALGGGSLSGIYFVGPAIFILLLLAISELARCLGAGCDGQMFSVLLCATIAAVFVQATTFKPEILASFWYVLLVIAALKLWRSHVGGEGCVAYSGALLGLLLLTHGVGYVFGMPLVLWMGLAMFRRWPLWRGTGAMAVLLLVAALLNVGYWGRNLEQFGHALGPVHPSSPNLTFLNATMTPAITAENCLRNIAAVSGSPCQTLNNGLNAGISAVAEVFGLNLDDPRCTFPGDFYDGVFYSPSDEYRQGWPVLMYLLPLTLLLCFKRGDARRAGAGWLMVVLIVALLTFSTVVCWAQTIAHLLLPLACVLAGATAASMEQKIVSWISPMVAVTAVAALVPTMLLFPRSLVGPGAVEDVAPEVTFTRGPGFTTRELSQLSAYIALLKPKPRTIGIDLNGPHPIFALQYALLRSLQPRPTFEYFNASVQVPGRPETDPDIVIGSSSEAVLCHRDTGTLYHRVKICGGLGVFCRALPREQVILPVLRQEQQSLRQ